MILPDTSIWVDHFRSPNAALFDALYEGKIVSHTFVLGELMLGGLKRHHEAMRELMLLPPAPTALPVEIVELIETASLHGRGIGYVDAALLASSLIEPGLALWTADKKLLAVAEELAIAFRL